MIKNITEMSTPREIIMMNQIQNIFNNQKGEDEWERGETSSLFDSLDWTINADKPTLSEILRKFIS